MKLIIAIVRDSDSETVLHSLMTHNLRVTQIASSGGFLRRGNSTLLVGVEDEQLESTLQMIRENCKPAEGDERRGVIFVIKVDQFIHF